MVERNPTQEKKKPSQQWRKAAAKKSAKATAKNLQIDATECALLNIAAKLSVITAKNMVATGAYDLLPTAANGKRASSDASRLRAIQRRLKVLVESGFLLEASPKYVNDPQRFTLSTQADQALTAHHDVPPPQLDREKQHEYLEKTIESDAGHLPHNTLLGDLVARTFKWAKENGWRVTDYHGDRQASLWLHGREEIIPDTTMTLTRNGVKEQLYIESDGNSESHRSTTSSTNLLSKYKRYAEFASIYIPNTKRFPHRFTVLTVCESEIRLENIKATVQDVLNQQPSCPRDLFRFSTREAFEHAPDLFGSAVWKTAN